MASGRFDASLSTADPEEFPVLPTAEDSTALDFNGSQLRRAIERVAIAAARDDSRPILAAVLFEVGEPGLTIAAADGFRLARGRSFRASLATTGICWYLFAQSVSLVAYFLEAETARLMTTPDGGGLHLIAGDTTLFTRLVDGRFPDIERVIPTAWETRVVVQTASFRQAVRVAGLFGKDGQVRPVVFEARPRVLRLSARGDEVGEAEGEFLPLWRGNHSRWR